MFCFLNFWVQMENVITVSFVWIYALQLYHRLVNVGLARAPLAVIDQAKITSETTASNPPRSDRMRDAMHPEAKRMLKRSVYDVHRRWIEKGPSDRQLLAMIMDPRTAQGMEQVVDSESGMDACGLNGEQRARAVELFKQWVAEMQEANFYEGLEFCTHR